MLNWESSHSTLYNEVSSFTSFPLRFPQLIFHVKYQRLFLTGAAFFVDYKRPITIFNC